MAVCALASKKSGGRPVKWVETRSEHMVSSAHGNERTFRNTRVALDKDGVITAIDSNTTTTVAPSPVTSRSDA